MPNKTKADYLARLGARSKSSKLDAMLNRNVGQTSSNSDLSEATATSGSTTTDTIKKGFKSPFLQQLEQAASNLPIVDISVDLLLDNPYQHLARTENYLAATDLEGLAASIRENGFYGTLVARPSGTQSGFYELAFGHRRREAAKLAGLTTLPIKILDLSDVKMAQLMASENFARQDLTPLGEANVIGLLAASQNMSISKIAKVVGQGEGWVELRLKLDHAAPNIKSMVEARPGTLGHIRLLEQVTDLEEQQKLIDLIIQDGMTRQELKTRLNSLHSHLSTSSEVEVEGLAQDDIVNNFTDALLQGDSEIINNQVGGNTTRIDENTNSKPIVGTQSEQNTKSRSNHSKNEEPAEPDSSKAENSHKKHGDLSNAEAYDSGDNKGLRVARSNSNESFVMEVREAAHEVVLIIEQQGGELENYVSQSQGLLEVDNDIVKSLIERLHEILR